VVAADEPLQGVVGRLFSSPRNTLDVPDKVLAHSRQPCVAANAAARLHPPRPEGAGRGGKRDVSARTPHYARQRVKVNHRVGRGEARGVLHRRQGHRGRCAGSRISRAASPGRRDAGGAGDVRREAQQPIIAIEGLRFKGAKYGPPRSIRESAFENPAEAPTKAVVGRGGGKRTGRGEQRGGRAGCYIGRDPYAWINSTSSFSRAERVRKKGGARPHVDHRMGQRRKSRWDALRRHTQGRQAGKVGPRPTVRGVLGVSVAAKKGR